MTQALYAHMNNKIKKKINVISQKTPEWKQRLNGGVRLDKSC
jgi:hypothetical protein